MPLVGVVLATAAQIVPIAALLVIQLGPALGQTRHFQQRLLCLAVEVEERVPHLIFPARKRSIGIQRQVVVEGVHTGAVAQLRVIGLRQRVQRLVARRLVGAVPRFFGLPDQVMDARRLSRRGDDKGKAQQPLVFGGCQRITGVEHGIEGVERELAQQGSGTHRRAQFLRQALQQPADKPLRGGCAVDIGAQFVGRERAAHVGAGGPDLARKIGEQRVTLAVGIDRSEERRIVDGIGLQKAVALTGSPQAQRGALMAVGAEGQLFAAGHDDAQVRQGL